MTAAAIGKEKVAAKLASRLSTLLRVDNDEEGDGAGCGLSSTVEVR